MKKIKTIGLVLPCGNIRNLDEVNEKIALIEKDFKVKKFYQEDISNGYLSDSDENRAKYLEQAFLDDETDLILNVRGGFGALRIVDKINYNLIKNCDKFYASSSDGSILLASLSKMTSIKCFHSLMITNGFVENLKRNIEIIENNIFDIDLKPIKKGVAKGKLFGGNLSSLVSMFSDEQYLPNENIILFLEDLNEPMYKLDKMFYEIYRNSALKNKIKGIIFGDFYLEKNEITPLLKEYSSLFNIPTWQTNDITHKPNNITLPCGKFINL